MRPKLRQCASVLERTASRHCLAIAQDLAKPHTDDSLCSHSDASVRDADDRSMFHTDDELQALTAANTERVQFELADESTAASMSTAKCLLGLCHRAQLRYLQLLLTLSAFSTRTNAMENNSTNIEQKSDNFDPLRMFRLPVFGLPFVIPFTIGFVLWLPINEVICTTLFRYVFGPGSERRSFDSFHDVIAESNATTKRSYQFVAEWTKFWAATSELSEASKSPLGAVLPNDVWTIVKLYSEPKTATMRQMQRLFSDEITHIRNESTDGSVDFLKRVEAVDSAFATGGYFLKGLKNAVIGSDNWLAFVMRWKRRKADIIPNALLFCESALVREVFLSGDTLNTDALFEQLPGDEYSAVVHCILTDIGTAKRPLTLPKLRRIAPAHIYNRQLCALLADNWLPFHKAIETFSNFEAAVDSDYLKLLLPVGDDYTLDAEGSNVLEFAERFYGNKPNEIRHIALHSVFRALPFRLQLRVAHTLERLDANTGCTDEYFDWQQREGFQYYIVRRNTNVSSFF